MGLAKFDAKLRQWRTLRLQAGDNDSQLKTVLNTIQWRAF
jgi:hypothetical protein